MRASLIRSSQGKANSIYLITVSSCNYPMPLFIDGPAWRQWIGQQAFIEPTQTYNIAQCSVTLYTVNKDESLQQQIKK